MNYREALDYLESFTNYERIPSFNYKKSLKLERMSRLAGSVGNPHLNLRCIHVAGTKGKGSTSAMAASILKEAGYRVGLYTSPHLISFRERIKINDDPIKEEELCGIIDRIKPVIDAIDKKSDFYPTFFEIYTTIAFLYFEEKKTDFCVVETGLGGRLDATNIIEKPLCCGITQISLEHTQALGDTLEAIAAEKACIIKEGRICVSSTQEVPVMEVIAKKCRDKNNRLFVVGSKLLFKKENRQVFSVKGIFGEYPFAEVGLAGDHQFMNAATAIGLIESLRFYDIIVSASDIMEGLKNVKWPGRLQVLARDPYVVLDGAQNKASARALKEAVTGYFNYNKLILVLGISSDKDIRGICEELVPLSDEIILTKANIPRAQEPLVLSKFVGKPSRITGSVSEAMDAARGIAGPQDLILVTGSLFVVGEVLKEYQSSVLSACA